MNGLGYETCKEKGRTLGVCGSVLTSFALAGSVQVVVGAEQLALAVDAAVVDAG